MPDHGLAVPVGSHASRLALEQRHAEHVLEVLEQLRCRGLRHVQHLGGAMDVAFIAYRGEQHELARLEARTNEPGRGRGHLFSSPPSPANYISMGIAPYQYRACWISIRIS